MKDILMDVAESEVERIQNEIPKDTDWRWNAYRGKRGAPFPFGDSGWYSDRFEDNFAYYGGKGHTRRIDFFEYAGRQGWNWKKVDIEYLMDKNLKWKEWGEGQPWPIEVAMSNGTRKPEDYGHSNEEYSDFLHKMF